MLEDQNIETSTTQGELNLEMDANCPHCVKLAATVKALTEENLVLKAMIANLKKPNSRNAGIPPKLNEAQRAEVLEAYVQNVPVAEIAVRYQVSRGTIYNIINKAAK